MWFWSGFKTFLVYTVWSFYFGKCFSFTDYCCHSLVKAVKSQETFNSNCCCNICWNNQWRVGETSTFSPSLDFFIFQCAASVFTFIAVQIEGAYWFCLFIYICSCHSLCSRVSSCCMYYIIYNSNNIFLIIHFLRPGCLAIFFPVRWMCVAQTVIYTHFSWAHEENGVKTPYLSLLFNLSDVATKCICSFQTYKQRNGLKRVRRAHIELLSLWQPSCHAFCTSIFFLPFFNNTISFLFFFFRLIFQCPASACLSFSPFLLHLFRTSIQRKMCLWEAAHQIRLDR